MHFFVVAISFAEACKIQLGKIKKNYEVMGLEILLLVNYKVMVVLSKLKLFTCLELFLFIISTF